MHEGKRQITCKRASQSCEVIKCYYYYVYRPIFFLFFLLLASFFLSFTKTSTRMYRVYPVNSKRPISATTHRIGQRTLKIGSGETDRPISTSPVQVWITHEETNLVRTNVC